MKHKYQGFHNPETNAVAIVRVTDPVRAHNQIYDESRNPPIIAPWVAITEAMDQIDHPTRCHDPLLVLQVNTFREQNNIPKRPMVLAVRTQRTRTGVSVKRKLANLV